MRLQMDLHGSVAPWVSPILGQNFGGHIEEADAVEQRALSLLTKIDPSLAKELTQALFAARWLLPLLVFRRPPAQRLTPREREHALRRAVQPPFVLRPLRSSLRGITRGIKLLVVFPYFTQDGPRQSIGYLEMADRTWKSGIDLTPYEYPTPEDDLA